MKEGLHSLGCKTGIRYDQTEGQIKREIERLSQESDNHDYIIVMIIAEQLKGQRYYAHGDILSVNDLGDEMCRRFKGCPMLLIIHSLPQENGI